MEATSVLPYRTDAPALGEWLAARARGRSAEQLRVGVGSPKAVEGTAASASALGFIGTNGELTSQGERYALADLSERRRLLHEALLAYPPYCEMLRALEERGAPAETEVRWVEAWWATRGYGSSESNRREGAAAFGRLGDFAGLGEYVPGRRGHPTRIRWSSAALGGRFRRAAANGQTIDSPDRAPDLFSVPTGSLEPPRPRAAPAERGGSAPRGHAAVTPVPTVAPRSPARHEGAAAVNRITVPLAGNATARIEVPLRLPRAEKQRLLDLLQLLITED